MKRKILFLFFSILISCGAHAQGEASNWFFGANTGLNFNDLQTVTNATINGTSGQTLTRVPRSVNGPINTGEGCFSISDKYGNFLFASDGITVYNGTSNTNIMKNGTGLMGHSSANQSGIMIPKPETDGRYYIVTAPCRLSSTIKEIFYSEVDLTVTNAQGRGEVLMNGTYGTLPSNITKLNLTGLAADQAYENIAAVRHANGKDYWLVHRARQYLYVWLITKDGFNGTNPYNRINLGYDPGVPLSGAAGQIKFSSDGKYVAVCTGHNQRISIGEFNASTGGITNMKTNTYTGLTYIYSIEFSPNSEYIYVVDVRSVRSVYVMKFSDFMAGTGTFSQILLFTAEGGVLQTGPDNRIYAADKETKNLDVILNPDEGGTQVARIQNYMTNTVTHGLPTFVASFFSVGDIEADPVLPVCFNTAITFSVQVAIGYGVNQVTKMEWDFGDGSTIVTEDNMDQYNFVQSHIYTNPGRYSLTLTPYKANGDVLTDKVKTMEVDISQCIFPVNPNVHMH